MTNGISTMRVFDKAFLFIFAALSVSTIVLAFQIEAHPAMFFLSVIMLMIVLMTSGILSNVFELFSQNEGIAVEAVNYTFVMRIMANLPAMLFGVGVLLLVVLYGKVQNKPW